MTQMGCQDFLRRKMKNPAGGMPCGDLLSGFLIEL